MQADFYNPVPEWVSCGRPSGLMPFFLTFSVQQLEIRVGFLWLFQYSIVCILFFLFLCINWEEEMHSLGYNSTLHFESLSTWRKSWNLVVISMQYTESIL